MILIITSEEYKDCRRSQVVNDVPSDSIVAGIPAKVIKKFN